jgi:hypothetical protein
MRKPWTKEEVELMAAEYPNEQTSIIAQKLQRSIKSVFSQAFIMGLKKTEAFMNSEKSGRMAAKDTRGLLTRFEKGNQPWNKGIKGFMGPNKTSFSKGQKPYNHKPVGSTRIDSKDGYLIIKIAEPNKWKLLHRHIWEQSNGQIPKGMNIIFKDGNKLNCALENMAIITREENMKRNTIHQYPEEVKQTIRTLTKLKKTIRNHGTKQN